MNRNDLLTLLESPAFSPFVITMADGAAYGIGEEERRHILAAARKLIIMDGNGNLTYLPYSAIAHIDEPKT